MAKADTDNCYRVTWGFVGRIAQGMGIDLAKLDRGTVSGSINRQIDLERIIRVALADAYEQMQEAQQ